MGCVNSSNKLSGSSLCVRDESKGKLLELVEPEPDFGWRRIFNEETEKLAAQHYRHAIGGSNPQLLLASYMTPSMFNDNTAGFCTVHIVTLALNIAWRAAKLAQLFGVMGGGGDDRWQVTDDQLAGGEDFRIYEHLNIPIAGWHLVERLWRPARSRRVGTAKDNCWWWETRLLSRMQTGGQMVAVDVGEIGLNKSEELYRLEKKSRLESSALPTEMFGWKFIHELPGGQMQLVSVVHSSGVSLFTQ
eukprot:GHVS01053115.1.p1 GENE.GHVS01053115.1~~GHVS01053115.1.p1  ORF type:complete len:246 (-),score=40.50 GHVS01053115.1:571-1308(-)